jgi:predicted ArsR family transcriptional regulator
MTFPRKPKKTIAIVASPPAPREPLGVRGTILAFLKQSDGGQVADVAKFLRISYEGARQHLTQLEKDGLIKKRVLRPEHASAGRPVARYALSMKGEQFLPKQYDELTTAFIDALAERLGPAALKQVLGTITDKRVAEWTPRLEGKSLMERIKALEQVYGDDDPYMSAEIGSDGAIRLIERNCPFLNVASRRPVLCSVTVCTLQRLLGFKVVREERFQSGHGRCVFRVLTDQPVDVRDFHFDLEPDTLGDAV